MELYENPIDQRIYDTEQIRERARQDFCSHIEEEKSKKKRKQAIRSGIVISGFLLLLLYVLWTFMKSAQLLNF